MDGDHHSIRTFNGHADALVSEIWGHAIRSINDVLNGNRYFGFKHFEAFADPSIEEIIHSITIIDALISAVMNSKFFEDNPEVQLKLLNCQQTVHLIRRTYASLKSGDEAEYKLCIAKLETQRQH